jgi:autotransporter-associated beta strand protein
MVLATGCGLILGEACEAATVTGSSSNVTYAVSSADLLQSDLRSVESALTLYPEPSFVNGTIETLTDGTAAFASDTRMYSYGLFGGSVVYTLNTAFHPSGYDISAINTYSGWQDTGRINQNYEVSFRMVGSDTFGNTISAYYAGTATQTRVAITDINLTGVEAIRFTFLTQQNNGVGYRELDVFGSASSNAYAVAGTSGDVAFDVAADDLLQTSLLSATNRLAYYTESGFGNAQAAALTDGSFGSASKTNGTCAVTNGWIVYTLDTTSCPAGYQVSEVHSYSGWDDTTRDDQRYTVSFRKVGTQQFTDAVTVDYTGTVSQAHVAITHLAVSHVEAVRFAFSASQENGAVGYKELDVIGTPAAYADMELTSDTQMIASNTASNVRIVGDGAVSGTFTLDSPVTVIDTLTHCATGGVATLDPAGQMLKVNRLFVQPEASALTIGTGSNNGTLASAADHLYFGVAGTNSVTVHASITNGSYSSSLFKFGSGLLTLDGTNTYSGDTVVNAGTLKLSGNGSLGRGGALRVQDAKLQINNASAYAKREVIFTNAVIEQTAGLLRSDNNIQAQNATLILSGGSSYVFNDWFLGRGGTNVALTMSGGHTAECCLVRFESGAVTLDLQNGTTLYADQLTGVGATGTVLFDGSTLGVCARDFKYASNTWITSSSGTLSVYVKDGGAIFDTSRGNATLRQPLLRWGSSVGGLTKKGAKTLTLASPCYYAGDTVVVAGTLKLQVPQLLVNAGFELPYTTAYTYLVSDGVNGGWTMSSTQAGVARSGSSWVLTTPEGAQVGFLQKTSFMKQTVSIPSAGAYRLSFSGSGRPNYQGADRVELRIDGTSVAAWETNAFDNSTGVFSSQSTTNLLLSAGSHEIQFVGSTPDGADRATAIDNVQLVGVENGFVLGPLPTATRLTVATGATLDLAGVSQTLGELNGGGLVANSASNSVRLTVGGNNTSTNFSGSIQGAVSFIKTGTGKLSLVGTNTYSGETVVSGGTLSIAQPIGVASYATTNTYSFVPATNNVLRGLTPSATANTLATPPEGTGSITNLTDGVIVSTGVKATDYPYTYAVNNNVVLTYTVGTINDGCFISQINIYSGWGDTGRDNITMASISYSTVSDPTTFVAIPNSSVNYANGLGNAKATLTANVGLLAANVYAIRFNFGAQENSYVGYRELEVIGVRSSCLPTGTAITVATGATLDLNGNKQSVAGLSGSGTVTNGTLAVSGTIAPGGTNVIGTLTLAASVGLSGTLLIDVDPSGTSDLLQVQAALDLSGMTLQIQDLSLLKNSSPYLIATCAPGGLSGRFVSTNLDGKRTVCYDKTNGRVLLVGSGTLIVLH